MQAKRNIEINYVSLQYDLSRALAYFLRQDAALPHVPLAAMSPREKIQWLEDIIRSRSADLEYLGHFGKVFAYLLWVDSQRERVLRSSHEKGIRLALAPMGWLSDFLAHASIELNDALGSFRLTGSTGEQDQ
jgi:hypothetical protein